MYVGRNVRSVRGRLLGRESHVSQSALLEFYTHGSSALPTQKGSERRLAPVVWDGCVFGPPALSIVCSVFLVVERMRGYEVVRSKHREEPGVVSASVLFPWRKGITGVMYAL